MDGAPRHQLSIERTNGPRPEAALRELARVRDPVGLHRRLRRWLGVPHDWANVLVRGLQIARNPRDALRRGRLARAIIAQGKDADGFADALGWRVLGPDFFPNQTTAVAAATEIFEASRTNGRLARALESTNKRFLISLMNDGEFFERCEVLALAISRPVLDMVARYLETVPVLHALRLYWTPANDTAESSQLFHLDAEGTRQVKFFFNLTDVDSDSGPLTVLSAKTSEPISRDRRTRRRKISDAGIEALGLSGQWHELIGQKGHGAVVDTSRCLHRGSLGNRRERAVLMFQYAPAACPRASAPRWDLESLRLLEPLDTVQRLALNLRP